MLTLAQVLAALNPGDWMVALDLQDAYFHIPVLPAHRRYLRFMVGHEHFQFTVLPFGLTSAPRVFTKVMAVVAAHLRRLGVSVFPYLDDWLLKAGSPQTVVSHLQTTADLLHQLGFSINVPKSHLCPSQKLLFIGAVLDSARFRVYPPEQRVRDIQALIPIFQPLSRVSVRLTLRLLGLMASCILLVHHARWRMRALQWDLKFQWAQHQGNLSDHVLISEGTARQLQWWLTDRDWVNGRSLSLPQPEHVVVTGASLQGWGGHMGDAEIRGLWSPAEARLHINLLELRAIRLALKAFLPSVRGSVVQVFTDNTTAMWYCNKQGGVGSWILCQEALCLWQWLERQGVTLVAQHLAGSLNARADELSRRCMMDHEWRLNSDVAQGLFQRWGEPWLDLFAAEENAQCHQFCALEFPRRHSLGDAFRREWSCGLLYAFPPIPLLPRVLKKIKRDRAQVILVAPDWVRRYWYPELLSMSVDPPVRLPLQEDLLSQQQGTVLHPNLSSLHLHAWRLSGDS
ncbi:uncharacterized protein LOC144753171 [Lissotriton helveticus]